MRQKLSKWNNTTWFKICINKCRFHFVLVTASRCFVNFLLWDNVRLIDIFTDQHKKKIPDRKSQLVPQSDVLLQLILSRLRGDTGTLLLTLLYVHLTTFSPLITPFPFQNLTEDPALSSRCCWVCANLRQPTPFTFLFWPGHISRISHINFTWGLTSFIVWVLFGVFSCYLFWGKKFTEEVNFFFFSLNQISHSKCWLMLQVLGAYQL